MKHVEVPMIVLAATLSGSPALAGDPIAGKAKFAVCAGCHGPDGMGNAALGYPQLAGKDAAYVATQLRDFKSGKRDSATMKAMAAGLNDGDIENVASYIATLK